MNVDFIKQAVGAPITKSPLRVQHKDIAAALKRAAGTGDAMPSNVRNSWSGKGVKVDTSKLFDKESGWLVKAAIDFLRPAVGSGAGSSATPAVGVLFKNYEKQATPQAVIQRLGQYAEDISGNEAAPMPQDVEVSPEAQQEFQQGLGQEQSQRFFGPTGAFNWALFRNLPGVGTALTGKDTLDSIRQGDVASTALNAGFTAMNAAQTLNMARQAKALQGMGMMKSLAGFAPLEPAGVAAAAEMPAVAVGINSIANLLDLGRGYMDERNPANKDPGWKSALGDLARVGVFGLKGGLSPLKQDRLMNAYHAVGNKNLESRAPGAGWMSQLSSGVLDPAGSIMGMYTANNQAGGGWDTAKRMADRARASMSQGGPVNEASKAQMQRLHDRIKQESGRGMLSRMFGGTQKWTAAPQPAKG